MSPHCLQSTLYLAWDSGPPRSTLWLAHSLLPHGTPTPFCSSLIRASPPRGRGRVGCPGHPALWLLLALGPPCSLMFTKQSLLIHDWAPLSPSLTSLLWSPAVRVSEAWVSSPNALLTSPWGTYSFIIMWLMVNSSEFPVPQKYLALEKMLMNQMLRK